MHNWQNTGDQKQQFVQASLMNRSPLEKEAALKYSKKHFQCPMCKVSLETAMHFLVCPTLKLMDKTIKRQNILMKKLRNISTYDGIVDLIIFLLRGGEMQDYSFHHFNKDIGALWVNAYESQSQIGWTSFLQGFWHEDWMVLQKHHSSLLKMDQNTTQWCASVIHELLKYAYDCWKIRNEYLHKDDNSEERRAELQQQVRRLYMDPDRFLNYTREKRRLFSVSLEKKLRCSNSTLESWIDIVELRLRLDREENARRTIIRWLRKKSD